MARSPEQLPDKICPVCGNTFNRKRFKSGLEDATRYASRKTCSQSCGNSKDEVTTAGYRSRAAKLRKANCETCGTTHDLDAHHKDGNIKNNDPSNIQTLCHACHMKLHWQQNPSFNTASEKRTQDTESIDLKPSETASSRR